MCQELFTIFTIFQTLFGPLLAMLCRLYLKSYYIIYINIIYFKIRSKTEFVELINNHLKFQFFTRETHWYYFQEKFKREFKERVFCNSLRRICCPNSANQDDEELALGHLPVSQRTNGIELVVQTNNRHLPTNLKHTVMGMEVIGKFKYNLYKQTIFLYKFHYIILCMWGVQKYCVLLLLGTSWSSLVFCFLISPSLFNIWSAKILI